MWTRPDGRPGLAATGALRVSYLGSTSGEWQAVSDLRGPSRARRPDTVRHRGQNRAPRIRILGLCSGFRTTCFVPIWLRTPRTALHEDLLRERFSRTFHAARFAQRAP